MITKEQKTLAEVTAAELEDAQRRTICAGRVQVRFAHKWPNQRDAASLGVASEDFYNVVGGDYHVGSTIRLHTLTALGYVAEVLP